MAVKLIIAPETEYDVADAYSWYERQRIGLGAEFLTCVDACIQLTMRYPEIHAIVHGSYRRGLVRRFPYAVLYEYIRHIVTVYGVFHNADDPEKWRLRLS